MLHPGLLPTGGTPLVGERAGAHAPSDTESEKKEAGPASWPSGACTRARFARALAPHARAARLRVHTFAHEPRAHLPG